MSINQLMSQLRERNVGLALNGDDLVVRGKKTGLDKQLLSLLREHKPTLIEIIRKGEYVANANFEGDKVVVPPTRIVPGCDRIVPDMLPLVALSQANIDYILSMVPGGAANVVDIYPLAPLQSGMVFHHMMAERSDPFLLMKLMTFDSRARLDRYMAALQAVIDRHDMLRTAILWEGLPEPVQVVLRAAPLELELLELSPADGDIELQLRERFALEKRRIDIRRAPMLKVSVAFDPVGERWMFVLLVHHVIGDRIGFGLMDEEIWMHYAGKGGQLKKPEPFRNFIAHARLGVSEAEHETFFRDMLGDVEESTLPFGLTEMHGETRAVNIDRFRVKADVAQALRAHARTLGVSAASVFHLAWALVLARICGKADVVFGTILFGRMQAGEGADRILGMCMNTLPVRVKIGEVGIDAGIRYVNAQLAGLMMHEHAPLSLAQRCSGVAASAPLFSSMINFRHNFEHETGPLQEQVTAMEGIESLSSEERNSYPLTVTVDDLGDDFGITIQVQDPINSSQLCAYMAAALGQLAEAISLNPSQPLRTLDVLPEAERLLVLEQWNATADEPDARRSIHSMFERQVAATPDAVALVYQGSTLSYAQLNERVNALAHYLIGAGVGANDMVGLCMERSLELIVGILGIVKAGAAYVPLDPSYPRDRLAMMVEDAQPKFMLTQGHVLPRLPTMETPAFCLDTQVDVLAAYARENPVDTSAPEHLAYVIYTSGSTGKPKGTLIHRRGLENLLHWYVTKFALTGADKVLLFSSVSFDLTQKNIFAPLLVGGQLHIPLEGYAPDTAPVYVGQHGISCINCAPSAFYPLLSNGLVEQAASLRHIFLGGEPINTQLLHAAFVNADHTALQVHNTYGPTEASDVVAYYSWNPKEAIDSIPIGQPVTNTRLYVLDSHHALVPLGAYGEICVGGIGVGYGYLHRPELTSERFVDDPFVSGGKMYKTGDIGRWRSDGQIEFFGRQDFQVKIRGFRVELSEIEGRIAEFPSVREAVALVREDVEGDKRLVAYVTLKDGAAQDPLADVEATQVARWRDAYEIIYSESKDQVEMDDFAGWTSSYTGQPLPEAEMLEWREHTVARIRALQPRRVLEIGCGSGLLLLQIAPHCESYVGTDFSSTTLQHLSRRIAAHGLRNVRLYERRADDLGDLDEGQFDLIVINSVIQYFPSLDYLDAVIAEAGSQLTPGGHIFIGDVRNLSLIGAHHASIQWHRRRRDDHISDLRERVRNAIDMEKELLVHPAYFLSLCAGASGWGGARVLPKVSVYSNELTNTRYDVILHTQALHTCAEAATYDWTGDEMTPATLQVRLISDQPDVVWICNIINPEVELLVRLHERLWDEGCDLDATAARTDEGKFTRDGIAPHALAELAASLGYRMEPSWAQSDARGSYGVTLQRIDVNMDGIAYPLPAVSVPSSVAMPRTCANDPLKFMARNRIGEQLKISLQNRLPAHMVPSHIVFLDALPLTGNGKVNRAALPPPEMVRHEESEVVLPRTDIESRIAAVWRNLLKLEKVGVHDDFFTLGGHSLLAVQMVNTLKQQGIGLLIADVFRNPTIESMAACVMAADGRVSEDAAIPIRTGGNGAPLFLVHEGAATLLYAFALAPHLEPDIPVYGLSVEPIETAHLTTLEGMATRLMGMIRAVQAEGPYRIAGYCGGGMLAYEIASQLLGDDQDVAFLGMLNTAYVPPGNYLDNLLDVKSRLLAQTRPVIAANPELVPAHDFLLAHLESMDMAALIDACRKQCLLPPTLTGLSTLQVEQTVQRLHNLVVAADAGGYVSQPISIPVHYFSAKDDTSILAILRGWDAVLPASQFLVIPVPGTHDSMVQAPNAQVLGKALSAAIKASEQAHIVAPERHYAPLVSLQPGHCGVGTLVCIPGAGATVASFVDLLDSVSAELTVVGMQPRGMEGQLVPATSVGAAAQAYLRAMELGANMNAIHLLGHSFGGWVALEIALRLEAVGMPVASLTIIDSGAPSINGAKPECSHLEAIGHLIKIYEQSAGQRLGIAAADLAMLDEPAQRALLHARMVEAGLLPRRSMPELLRGTIRTFARCMRTPYKPTAVYPRTIHLVLADDPELDGIANAHRRQVWTEAWRPWANNLRVLHAPGDHMTVLKSPQVQTVGRWMGEVWQGHCEAERAYRCA